MTRKEAIKELEQRLSTLKFICGSYVDCVNGEAIEKAIEVLTKIEAIQEIIDMPFEWEQDDRCRYAKIVNIVRKNLAQEGEQ